MKWFEKYFYFYQKNLFAKSLSLLTHLCRKACSFHSPSKYQIQSKNILNEKERRHQLTGLRLVLQKFRKIKTRF